MVEVVDVGALPAVPEGGGPVVLWSASGQLQTNVVALPPGGHVAAHAEAALDVTLTLLTGALLVRHGPEEQIADLRAPAVVVLPAGTRRSLTAGPDGARYLTAHVRRPGLLPTVRRT